MYTGRGHRSIITIGTTLECLNEPPITWVHYAPRPRSMSNTRWMTAVVLPFLLENDWITQATVTECLVYVSTNETANFLFE